MKDGKPIKPKRKPTIAELERLLDEPDRPIQILPNGEVRTVRRQRRKKPITMTEAERDAGAAVRRGG